MERLSPLAVRTDWLRPMKQLNLHMKRVERITMSSYRRARPAGRALCLPSGMVALLLFADDLCYPVGEVQQVTLDGEPCTPWRWRRELGMTEAAFAVRLGALCAARRSARSVRGGARKGAEGS